VAIPFFRKGPSEPGSSDSKAKTSRNHDSSGESQTSLLDFSQIGEVRALAAAAGKIRVAELSDTDHPAVEEAAILFANGTDDAATEALEAAIDNGAANNEMLWSMLFDLYRLTDGREAFEQRGVAYAQQFGRSPPVWTELGHSATPKPIQTRNAVPTISLTGNLGGSSGAQFEQVSKIALKAGKMRIELARLRSVDESGCELLLSLLHTLRKARVVVQLSSPRTMLTMIENHAQAGRREGQAIWLMVLELIQALGEADRFDEVALDYAITFEESPPSYEAPAADAVTTTSFSDPTATGTNTGTGGLELVPIEEDAPQFVLEGELSSAQSETIRSLAKYGADRSIVDIDASHLQRMDFVSAGTLFNVLVQFQTQGKQSAIHGLNAMVAALLRVMGVHQVASMELRRG